MKLIGIAGKKRAGKDTLAKFILEETGGIRVAFADALKQEVCAMLGITLEELETEKELYRPLLQWHGTEYRRGKFGDDYWIRKMKLHIETAKATGVKCFVVPDVRLRNEAALIQDMGGQVVRVVQLGQASSDTHRSETDTDALTLKTVAAAKGDLDTLRKAAKALVKL